MNELTKLREEIDQMDEELVTLISHRMAVVKKIGEFKKKKGIPALDQKRWNDILSHRLILAKRKKLDQKFIREIFEQIHIYALKIESSINKKLS